MWGSRCNEKIVEKIEKKYAWKETGKKIGHRRREWKLLGEDTEKNSEEEIIQVADPTLRGDKEKIK